MTWKISALTSGAAVIVTALAAFVAPIEHDPSVPGAVPEAVDGSGAVVDLGAQADRLQTKLAEVTAYREPGRNVFRFGSAPRRLPESSTPSASEAAPEVIAPSKPPYALAGMATTVENGFPQRTAVLSSLQGVLLVKEGDVVEGGGYRVLSILEDAVTLVSTSDGTATTLRLPGSGTP